MRRGLLLLALSPLQGQALPALTDGERKAMAAIQEARVRETIRYLASDELEGRDTPSKGLRMASDFVAARFRRAGLAGLGEDGSFFLVGTISVVRREGIVLRKSGAPVPHHGMLAAGQRDLRHEGRVVERDDLPEGGRLPVVIDARRTRGALRSAMFTLRSAATAARQGASALLVRGKKGGGLLQAAKAVQDEPAGRIGQMLARAPIPILAVDADFETGDYELLLPAAEKRPSPNRNVAGLLTGSDPKLRAEALLITAHLDHIGLGGRGEDKINNGADDNASGVTGVLSLADAFCALPEPPARSVIFMTFWGEEKGLAGSRHFVRNPAWPLDRIVANVNLEMLGRPEEGARHKAWMTGWTESDLGELVARGAQRAGVEVFRHRRFSPMLYRASDNWSFATKGVIAHSFSAGSLHRDYHQPSDEWEKLDLPHMTKVIRGLFAGCLPIAQGILTPLRR